MGPLPLPAAHGYESDDIKMSETCRSGKFSVHVFVPRLLLRTWEDAGVIAQVISSEVRSAMLMAVIAAHKRSRVYWREYEEAEAGEAKEKAERKQRRAFATELLGRLGAFRDDVELHAVPTSLASAVLMAACIILGYGPDAVSGVEGVCLTRATTTSGRTCA
jgi:hypothetical protein